MPARPPPTEPGALGAPLLILNLKAYENCLGASGLRIAEILQELGRGAGVATAVAPVASDLARYASALKIPVLAQHVDPTEPGARTGSIPVEALAAAGVRGSLLNHSEDPMDAEAIGRAVRRLAGAGLAAVVCAQNVDQARRLAILRPPYVAIEPPELIGGDRAVSTARPEVVSGTVVAVRSVAPGTQVLCGAGVHDRHDVRRAIELGSSGILVASAVARAPDPRAAILELLAGF